MSELEEEPRIQSFPIGSISNRVHRAALDAAERELELSTGEMNHYLKKSGRGLVVKHKLKFDLVFTIKPIKSNVKQESSGKKIRTKQGSKEGSPKKVGTKKAGKTKFTRTSPNPLD